MRNIFLFITLFLTTIIFSQIPQQSNTNSEVGITEHLGDTIPLDLVFKNENNEDISLRQLVDKPIILSLVYFNCPNICSPILISLNDAINKAPMELGKDYSVITVSFNFRDNPEQAAQKKKKFTQKYSKEKQKYWTFLTGDSTTIFKLINKVGFNIKPIGLDFIHPAALIIISPSGKITRYLYGTSFLPFDLKMAVVEAQREEVRPTINKVLEYCFSYDPQGQRYKLQVTKITATIILFSLIIFLIILIITKKKRKK